MGMTPVVWLEYMAMTAIGIILIGAAVLVVLCIAAILKGWAASQS